MEWIAINWELISSCAVVLIFIINATTKHFSQYTGAVKIALIVVEYLSLLTSRDVPAWLKWPLTSKPPQGPVDKLPKWIGMLALLFVLPSCASWQSGVKLGLDEAGYTVNQAEPLVTDHYKAKCEGVARVCHDAGDSACSYLKDCQAERAKWITGLKSIHGVRLMGYGALLAEREEDAKGYAARAAEMVFDIVKGLKAGGVL